MHLVLSIPTLAKILGVVDAWVLPGYTTWSWIMPRHGYCLGTLHMAGRNKAWILPRYDSTKLHHAKAWVLPA